jgi:hypothetical protein
MAGNFHPNVTDVFPNAVIVYDIYNMQEELRLGVL